MTSQPPISENRTLRLINIQKGLGAINVFVAEMVIILGIDR